MKKVLIPLVYSKEDSSPAARKHYVRSAYITKLARYELLPIFVPVILPRPMIDELYAMSDGLLIMGGWDIDPRYYKESNHPRTDPAAPPTDEVELYLLRRALEDKKPYLGICRGIQTLNIACGGTLHQHVPDLGLDEVHQAGEEYDENVLGILDSHEVYLERGSRAQKILGKDSIRTNSAHHQCIKDLGSGLVASGKTRGGVIEVVERDDPEHFCLAVQSHPEVSDQSFFEELFVELARRM